MTSPSIWVIKESISSWWTNCQLNTVFLFEHLTQDVSWWMPESFFSFIIVKFIEDKFATTFERSVDIPIVPLILLIFSLLSLWVQKTFIECCDTLNVFYFCNYNFLSESLWNTSSNFVRRSLESLSLMLVAIWHGNGNFISCESFIYFNLSIVKPIPNG